MSSKTTKSSIYPSRPVGSEILARYSPNDCTIYDKVTVALSSLFFVGGVFWVPIAYAWAWKRFRAIPKEDKKRRAVYATILLSATALFIAGPHRNHRFGEWIKIHKFNIWKSWFKFLAIEIVADDGYDSVKDLLEEQAIVAVSPHGLFPFALALSALGEISHQCFGKFRAVVASATALLPWVRDVLKWVNAVDASRAAVNKALADGDRIGLAPGGIAEMFEGYPKPNTSPNEEFMIVRKGIFRLAVRHGIPIIPVYCFGSTKLLKRLQLPTIIEKISLILRTSIVVMFGQFGLPIPFRRKLLYVMGKPIHPPKHTTVRNQVNAMFDAYCQEMHNIFDRHKATYGWEDKSLITLRR